MPRVGLPQATLICQGCEKQFVVNGARTVAYEARNGSVVRFCSKECADVAKLVQRPTFTCQSCGKVAESNRVWHKDRQAFGGYIQHQRYCSDPCRAAAKAIRSAAPKQFDCETCGTHVVRVKDAKGRWDGKSRFCSRACSAKSNMGVALGRGAGFLDKFGYRIVSINGIQLPEHRHVMEQALGRKLLPEETVHHVNGLRTDNRLENLELWSSRHGKGQRVEDKVRWCIEFLGDYPEILDDMGLKIIGQALVLAAACGDTRSPFDSIQ